MRSEAKNKGWDPGRRRRTRCRLSRVATLSRSLGGLREWRHPTAGNVLNSGFADTALATNASEELSDECEDPARPIVGAGQRGHRLKG